ncbi:hypothetical protein EBU99_07695 [bacterium]|nr:hypothetical protein [bacterium]
MKNFYSNLGRSVIRLAILILVLLPILIPFLEKSVEKHPPATLTVWLESMLSRTGFGEARARQELRQKLKLDDSVQINFRTWGSLAQAPAQDYEELLAQLANTSGPQVVVSAGYLWGPAARSFNRELNRLAQSGSRSILVVPPVELGWQERNPQPQRFLALSDLSAPQLNFLGEPSQLSLEIVGRLSSGESQSFEVVVRSGESLLASKTVSVTADNSGLVDSIQNIPVHFTRAQQQLLSAQLSTELSPIPMNMASTPVSVVHSKSTVLHVGVGPDWSLRNMRTKLKFWPNLDLLSYYILREVTDDLSIPSTQLSLIEFPSEKLFGEQLPNFHGVLAQNFIFDTYLNAKDTQHLYDYVNTSGGRLVIQAGPLSFIGQDSSIRDLIPCENIPEFDFQNEHRWQVGKNRFLSEAQFESAVGAVVTRQTALGCKPKPGALVLAETADPTPSPMILAYPVGKGLVVAFLASDWHTFGTQSEAATLTQRAHRVYALDASEHLFQWMVEFLQRRQDSGLRPPHFAGPRVYRDDPLLLVRSRGGLPAQALLLGKGESFAGGIASPLYLSSLGLEAIKWERAGRQSRLTGGSETAASNTPLAGPSFAESNRAPRFESTGLVWQSSESTLSGSTSSAGSKMLVWPILEGSTRSREVLANPTLFSFELLKISKEFVNSFTKVDEFKEHRIIPLLEAYPWLMALALAFLAVEQLIGRLRPRAALEAAIPAQQKDNA